MSTTSTTTLPLAAGAWELDANHSSVSFSIRHLGVSKVRGRFDGFTADLTVGHDIATTSVSAVIDVATVNTGNADRDAHVLADDMLDVAKRPTLGFRSTAIDGAGEEWTLVGDLTIGEVTRQISLAVELGGVEVFGGDQRRHAGFEAKGELRRSDFGLIPNIPAAMLGDVVKLELDLQFIEPTA